MRGKVIGKLTAGASYRITPAYAGKSDSKSAAALAVCYGFGDDAYAGKSA